MSFNSVDSFINHVTNETYGYMQKHDPKEYERLEADPAFKSEVTEAIAVVAKEEYKITKDLEKNHSGQDPEEVLRRHLSEKRMKLMEGALKIPTFKLDITKRLSDEKHVATFRGGDGLLAREPRLLTSNLAIDWSKVMQYASIVVEGVMLVMSAVGLNISPGEHAIEQAVDETAHVIQTSSKFQSAIEAFVKAWDEAGGSKWAKAKALFHLVKDTYAAGILWTIIKSLCVNMSWWDWTKTAAKVTAMIVAAFATDGAALIARIVLIIFDSFDFAKKIVNVAHLNSVKNEINK